MFSVLALGLLLACSGSPTVTPPAAPPTPQPTALAPLPELRAASGERWVMDEHTRASMRKLAPLLRGTDQSGPAQADAIDAELNVLVKGCTMTGPAHDQLHVFLGALFPRVDALRSGADAPALAATRDELATLASRYEAAFE